MMAAVLVDMVFAAHVCSDFIFHVKSLYPFIYRRVGEYILTKDPRKD